MFAQVCYMHMYHHIQCITLSTGKEDQKSVQFNIVQTSTFGGHFIRNFVIHHPSLIPNASGLCCGLGLKARKEDGSFMIKL